MSDSPTKTRVTVPIEQRLKLLNESDRELLLAVLQKWPAIAHAIADAEEIGLDVSQQRAMHESAGAAAQMLLDKHFPPIVPSQD